MLVDLRNKKIAGKMAELKLDEAGITVNKNAIPFDPKKPAVTSGIRIGTPAITTRGFTVESMRREILEWLQNKYAGVRRSETRKILNQLKLLTGERKGEL